jgi:hypothetical protein
MSKKKILIVSRAFYPMIAPRSYRATELAKEFAQQGHEVVALIHKRDHDYSEFIQENNIEIRDFVNGNWYDIKSHNNIFNQLLKGALKYFFLFPDIQLVHLVKNALKRESGYDLLISIAIPYPVHWGVAKAIKKNRNLTKVWIADCGDPFIGNKEQKIKFPFYFRFVENWFCNKPDYISVPLEAAINAYPKTCRRKIRVIPQGYKFEKDSSIFVKNPVPTFAYAGSLSKGVRDPGSFLEFLKRQTTEYKFIVYTRDVSLFKPYISSLTSRIEIVDYIPRDKLLTELKKMDFLVNFENRDKVQSPSKLIDYALTQRPILSVSSDNMDWKIAQEFLCGNYKNAYIVPNISNYNIENVSKQFLDLL